MKANHNELEKQYSEAAAAKELSYENNESKSQHPLTSGIKRLWLLKN